MKEFLLFLLGVLSLQFLHLGEDTRQSEKPKAYGET
jgi:hypothetical protein